MPGVTTKKLSVLLVMIVFFAFAPGLPSLAQDELRSLSDIAWSPDGSRIAGAYFDRIALWAATTGELQTTFPVKEIEFPDISLQLKLVAWSPDGKRLAVGANPQTEPSGVVIVMDVGTQQPVLQMQAEDGVGEVAWSPDGSKIAAAGVNLFGTFGDDALLIWDSATGAVQQEIKGAETDSVDTIAWSRDGKQIATGGGLDNTARLWDVNGGTLVGTLSGHSDFVNSIAWSPDGSRIATGSDDGTVQFWDATTLQAISTWKIGESVKLAVWNSDGSRVAVLMVGQTVQIWDATSGQSVGKIAAAKAVDWKPDGTQLAVGTVNDRLAIYDPSANLMIGQAAESSTTVAPEITTTAPIKTCSGTLPSRLAVGQQARVVPSWASNLRAEPSTDSERILIVAGRGVLTILDGPLCEAGAVWWQVEYDGQTGWTAEGNDTDYWLEPLPESETDTECPGAAPQRLQAGGQAKQALTRDPLIAKSDPTSEDSLYLLYPGAIVDVVAGPLCYAVGDLSTSWWQVKNADGVLGWVAESGPTKYFFAPYP